MAATMKQIAELAGVSIGTVDRALKKKGRVAPEVADRICKIAEALNYKPNTVAKSLAIRNQNLSIGVVIHVEKNTFYGEVISGVEKAAAEIEDFGISVQIRYGSDFDPEIQVQIIDSLLKEGVNALAIVPINHPLVKDKLNYLHESGFPVIFLSAFIEEAHCLSYVGCNYHKSGIVAAGLLNLIAKQPSKILALSPTFQMLGHKQRMDSLKSYLTANYPKLVLTEVTELGLNRIHNYQTAMDALNRNPDIDYVLCGSSATILQAVEEFSAVHKNIKVIGFDDSEAMRREIGKGLVLATITQNPAEQGYRATMLLFNYLTTGLAPEQPNYYMENQILFKESFID